MLPVSKQAHNSNDKTGDLSRAKENTNTNKTAVTSEGTQYQQCDKK